VGSAGGGWGSRSGMIHDRRVVMSHVKVVVGGSGAYGLISAGGGSKSLVEWTEFELILIASSSVCVVWEDVLDWSHNWDWLVIVLMRINVQHPALWIFCGQVLGLGCVVDVP